MGVSVNGQIDLQNGMFLASFVWTFCKAVSKRMLSQKERKKNALSGQSRKTGGCSVLHEFGLNGVHGLYFCRVVRVFMVTRRHIT